MIRRLLSVGFLVLLPALPARAQTAQEMFVEGYEILDEWSAIRHVVDLDGIPPLDVIGWYWTESSSSIPSDAVVRGYISDGLGGLQEVWDYTTPSLQQNGAAMNASTLGYFHPDGSPGFAILVGSHIFVRTLQGTENPIGYGHRNSALEYANYENPVGMVAVDCDGDGLDDLLTATPRDMRLFRNTGVPGLGTFQVAGTELLINGPGSALVELHIEIAVGELDGDPSQRELAVLRHDWTPGMELRIYRLVECSFQLMHSFSLDAPHSSHLAIGDVDGSGRDDIVIFGTDGMFQVLRQTAPGVFALEPRAPGGPSTTLIDVNGDGFLDGVCCSTGTGPGGGGSTGTPPNDQPSIFRVALNDGTGSFAPAAEFPGLGSKRIAGAVDMDGDGDVDLLAGEWSSSTISTSVRATARPTPARRAIPPASAPRAAPA